MSLYFPILFLSTQKSRSALSSRNRAEFFVFVIDLFLWYWRQVLAAIMVGFHDGIMNGTKTILTKMFGILTCALVAGISSHWNYSKSFVPARSRSWPTRGK